MNGRRFSERAFNVRIFHLFAIRSYTTFFVLILSFCLGGCNDEKIIEPENPNRSTVQSFPDFRRQLDHVVAKNGEKSCAAEIGQSKARSLSNSCLRLSPATHPPCNIENSCELIVEEIKRGCEYIKSHHSSFRDDNCVK